MKKIVLLSLFLLAGCATGYDLASQDISRRYVAAKQIEDPAVRREKMEQIRHDEFILEMQEEGNRSRRSAYLRSLYY